MNLDTVRDLFPGIRLPNGQNERAQARAEAAIDYSLKVNAELGADAGYKAANAPEIEAKKREDLAGLARPQFLTRIFPLVYGETLPVEFYPPGFGWVLAGVTLYPGILSTFIPTTNAVLQIHGLDEISDLYIPFSATAYHVSMRQKAYGTQKLSMVVLGTAGGALLTQPQVELQFENWSGGPLPSGE